MTFEMDIQSNRDQSQAINLILNKCCSWGRNTGEFIAIQAEIKREVEVHAIHCNVSGALIDNTHIDH